MKMNMFAAGISLSRFMDNVMRKSTEIIWILFREFINYLEGTLKGFEKISSIFRNVNFLVVAFMTGVIYYFEIEMKMLVFIVGGI